ncbi:MAG: hypothetical protein DRQ88_02280 [Epsilonproteobacteria bacterium]|nr:MAG: hypothetical protein DRQ89_01025 [Campylobacterota bacterium]RLA67688.1 MAG: hypothetical protein DRQ88_02280 [Campylobacterota bacterium]
MNQTSLIYQYSHTEEFINGFTHLLGIILGFYISFALLSKAITSGQYGHIFSYLIYGASFIALFASSTFYHFTREPKLKMILKKVDHICIYIFIAATYTPIILIKFHSPWNPWLLILVWVLALAGSIYKLSAKNRNVFVSVGTYLAMGYVCMLAINPMLEVLDKTSFYLLLIGGISFSIGVVFYLLKKVPFSHSIWHLFVLAGTIFHYLSINSIVN